VSSSAADVRGQTSPRPARWPWVTVALFFGVAIVGTILVGANGESVTEQLSLIFAFAMFGVVGALIVARDRRNVIGLLLLSACVVTAAGYMCGELVTWGVRHGHEGPVIILAGLLSNMGWALGISPALLLLPLLFPDGHIPSRRWRPLLWLILGFLAFLVLSTVFAVKTFTGSNDAIGVANPLYLRAIGRRDFDPVINLGYASLFLASVVSLFARFKGSTGVERQQIKWVAFGVLFAFVGIFSSDQVHQPVLNSIVSGLSFLAFPLSIGIAVLRFHLYDLDVVVKKAVVYASLVLFATLVYLGLVVGLGATVGQGSSFLTMVAAVVVAVTFQPVRAKLTRLANRLVYGRRATPYEVLSQFSERVGGGYSDEDILPRMARILAEGVGAERADVFLTVDRELRDVAVWPQNVGTLAPVTVSDGEVPVIEGPHVVYRVEHSGQLLGALAVTKTASDPVTPADEKLIADLAGQAGLALSNVRLTEELKLRLEDLKAAQKRLVDAQDEERRRLERNIHDGAQQQLVALAVKLKLADGMVEKDASKAHEFLGQLQAETQTTLEDLRDLARGIYPPLLADKGLAAALEAQARRSALAVEVRAEGLSRYPRAIETAVYFSSLEALQNAAKYSEASSVVVSLASGPDALTFTVTDDGRGFDPSATGYGTGLQGIADRLGALEGELWVRSEPGRGTTIEGRLPVAETMQVK
jgi:signal transduction histidine kinase